MDIWTPFDNPEQVRVVDRWTSGNWIGPAKVEVLQVRPQGRDHGNLILCNPYPAFKIQNELRKVGEDKKRAHVDDGLVVLLEWIDVLRLRPNPNFGNLVVAQLQSLERASVHAVMDEVDDILRGQGRSAVLAREPQYAKTGELGEMSKNFDRCEEVVAWDD